MRTLGEEPHEPWSAAVRIEQEMAVTELALYVGPGVLAGHPQFLSTVRALEQESTGFDLLAVGVWMHREIPWLGAGR